MSQSGILSLGSSPSGGIDTINGNTGTVTPVAGAVSIIGSGPISTSGSGSTLTISMDQTGFVKTLTATTGGALNPTSNNFNLVGSHGLNTSGTGSTITTAINNAITLGDLSPLVNADALNATTGNITVAVGNINISSGNINMPDTDGMAQTGLYNVGGFMFMHNSGDGGTGVFLGRNSGNLSFDTLSCRDNVFIGSNAGGSIASNVGSCVGIGAQCLSSVNSTADSNVAIGEACLSSLESGQGNCAIGRASLGNLATGEFNNCFGTSSGSQLIGAETGNQYFGNGGVTGENNTMRLGPDTVTDTYITGIFGQTVSAMTGVPVVIDDNDQLGTVVSSMRFKENIKDLENYSSEIYSLRPVSFNMIKDINKSTCYGLIAEEVNEVFPDMVVRDKNGEISSVKYQDLPILMLNELKKLKAEIDRLKNNCRNK